jgi:hypothetical protein
MSANLQIVLARRPRGAIADGDLVERVAPLPEPGPGEVRVKSAWLSLDPYMRGRMDDAPSYAPPAALGEVMLGSAVGVVEASQAPSLPVGTWVVGRLGWQQYACASAETLQAIDPAKAPVQRYLGALGMPGITAWIGLFDLARPRVGETLVVSAATGAVGSVVGQLAKHQGCRVVGVAGGPAKCEHAVTSLGFDACIDHRAPDFKAQLEAATPRGVDINFENVGGPVLEAVVQRLNPFARMPLCGLVSQYDAARPAPFEGMTVILRKRVHLQGFIVTDHLDRWAYARGALETAHAAGQLVAFETIVEGLSQAPRALAGLLRGDSLGKLLVKL